MALKTCEKCGIQQSADNYYKNRKKLDFLDSYCKKCQDRKNKINRSLSSGRKSLLKKYKLSLHNYDVLFSKQCGYCYICLKHQKEFKKKLAVDHCHSTGKIRGLLCSSCNTALGLIKDSTYTLKRMIDYLEKNK